MKTMLVVLFALFSLPSFAVPLDFDPLPQIIVEGLSDASYNATTNIFHEHNVAFAFLTDSPNATDDLLVTYDLTAIVTPDKVFHGGTMTLFGSSVNLGFATRLLLAGFVSSFQQGDQQFLAIINNLTFADPEIRGGNDPKGLIISSIIGPPSLPGGADWTSTSWSKLSNLHSPDIFSVAGIAAVPEPVTLALLLPGLVLLAAKRRV